MNSVPQVLVVGSANADLVVDAPRRPGAGETVLGGDTIVLPGGKGANTAVAAARLGAEVGLLGAVGEDAHGRLLLDSLREAGVGTHSVRRVDRPSGAAYITRTPDGENSILVSPGANLALGTEEVDAVDAAVTGADVLVASLEVPVETARHAVLRAARAGVLTVLNLSPSTPFDPTALAALDVLVVNEHEAAWLLGADLDGHEHELSGVGARAVVVTRGARPALVVESGLVTEFPNPEVEVVDSTGAGDAFAGALAHGLADGDTLHGAVRQAVRAAAVSVTMSGAQSSYPTADDVRAS